MHAFAYCITLVRPCCCCLCACFWCLYASVWRIHKRAAIGFLRILRRFKIHNYNNKNHYTLVLTYIHMHKCTYNCMHMLKMSLQAFAWTEQVRCLSLSFASDRPNCMRTNLCAYAHTRIHTAMSICKLLRKQHLNIFLIKNQCVKQRIS